MINTRCEDWVEIFDAYMRGLHVREIMEACSIDESLAAEIVDVIYDLADQRVSPDELRSSIFERWPQVFARVR